MVLCLRPGAVVDIYSHYYFRGQFMRACMYMCVYASNKHFWSRMDMPKHVCSRQDCAALSMTTNNSGIFCAYVAASIGMKLLIVTSNIIDW